MFLAYHCLLYIHDECHQHKLLYIFISLGQQNVLLCWRALDHKNIQVTTNITLNKSEIPASRRDISITTAKMSPLSLKFPTWSCKCANCLPCKWPSRTGPQTRPLSVLPSPQRPPMPHLMAVGWDWGVGWKQKTKRMKDCVCLQLNCQQAGGGGDSKRNRSHLPFCDHHPRWLQPHPGTWRQSVCRSCHWQKQQQEVDVKIAMKYKTKKPAMKYKTSRRRVATLTNRHINYQMQVRSLVAVLRPHQLEMF